MGQYIIYILSLNSFNHSYKNFVSCLTLIAMCYFVHDRSRHVPRYFIGAVSYLKKHFVWGSAGPIVRATQFTYCAVTTDIQSTIDDKPIILLIAQLTQMLNNLFKSFIISFVCFKDNLLLPLHLNDDRSCL